VPWCSRRHHNRCELIPIVNGVEDIEYLRLKSNIIDCGAGDHVFKKGAPLGVCSSLLRALSRCETGTHCLAFGPGDVFGTMAFLLARPRVIEMYAATDCRILSLSEGTVKKVIDSDARGAAHLMLSIAKILCLRLLQTR